MVWPFGKKKSKARHRSPVQALVMATQGLARAHSMVVLNESERQENELDTYSLPGDERGRTIVPHPSAGSCASRSASKDSFAEVIEELETTRHGKKKKKKGKGKPPKIENPPVEIAPTVEAVYQAENSPQARTRSPKKQSTTDTTTSVPSFISAPSSVSNETSKISVPSRKESSLENLLAKRVDPAVEQLRQVIANMQKENTRMTALIAKKDMQISTLNKDVQDLQLASADLKRDNLFFSAEVKSVEAKTKAMTKELFTAKMELGKVKTAKEEELLEVERECRDTEYKMELMKFENEKLRRDCAKSVSRVDHERVIATTQARFDQILKDMEMQVLQAQIDAKKEEEKISLAHGTIKSLLQEKEALSIAAQQERQKTADERARVAPLIVQNESLSKRCEMLLHKYEALCRDLDSANRQIHVQERVFTAKSSLGSQKSLTSMKEIMFSVQDDWRNVTELLKEVQEENNEKNQLQYQTFLKNIHDTTLDLRQREMNLSFREDQVRHANAIASLRENRF